MKLDMNKLAGSDRIKAAKDVLPAMAKPQAKEAAKAAAVPAKKAEKEPVKKAEVQKEAPKEEKAQKEAVEAVQATKAVEKSVPAGEKTANPVLKKKRGRPAIHPAKLDETGQKLINTNVPLDEELQLFLEYACEMDGGIAKASFIRKLVHSCYEKNFEGFHNWKKQRNKGLVMI